MTDNQSPRERFKKGMDQRVRSSPQKVTLKTIIAENIDLIDEYRAQRRTTDEIAAELGDAYRTEINVRSFATTLSSLRNKPVQKAKPERSATAQAPPSKSSKQTFPLQKESKPPREETKKAPGSSIEPIRQDDPDI